jgi:peptidase E
MRQILAMGGGGFWMEPDNPLLDEYVLKAAPARNPRICFLPTACGDSEARINQFYEAFGRLECRPAHLSLFRDPSNRREILDTSDIIYVGGGNTRLMLAIWKVYGVDVLLREAWERGAVLCGLSAGAICWFAEGVTDSDGPLGPMNCLGWLPGSCVPHYDGEAERRPVYHRLLSEGRIQPGIALDDGALAHYVDTHLNGIVTSRESAGAYSVAAESGTVTETALPCTWLGRPDKH